jgi:hypothetical protein
MASLGVVAVTRPDTMPDPVCNAKAEEVAVATTKRAQDTPAYMMDFLGKKQDAYKECMRKPGSL